jgi:hypothetical protein
MQSFKLHYHGLTTYINCFKKLYCNTFVLLVYKNEVDNKGKNVVDIHTGN